MSAASSLCRITGWGAVSPAGWSATALFEAVASGVPLPAKSDRRCEGAPVRRVRPVPSLATPPDWMKQPRFRRTTAIARFAVHAAVEAMGPERLARSQRGDLRVGTIFCSMNGGVQFSRRFFAEVEDSPSLASPILFPETVYNAPASHIASLLGSREINYTLVGDSAQFIAAMDLGSQWLADGIVDACLLVAAEELDWVTDEALLLFGKDRIAAEGAIAVLLEPAGLENAGLNLQALSKVCTYSAGLSRTEAARRIAAELAPHSGEGVLIFDGLGCGTRIDRPEREAMAACKGSHVSVSSVLGEGFAISSGWQTVAALEYLSAQHAERALVVAIGLGQQAVAAVLGR